MAQSLLNGVQLSTGAAIKRPASPRAASARKSPTGTARVKASRRGAPKAQERLTLEPILEAALSMLNEHGLPGLRLRPLAARLGIQPSAFYWHVHDKDELTTLLAQRLYEQARQAVPAGLAWRDWLLAFGQAFHRLLLQYRDSAQLCILAQPVAADVPASMASIATPLMHAGLDRETALHYYASVVSLTLGWAMYQQSAGMHDYLEQVLDFERGYSTGLQALVRGFA